MVKDIKISYAVTVCNEFLEIQHLLNFLFKHIRKEDEIVVLYDSVNGSKEVEEYLETQTSNGLPFRWRSYSFDNDFSKMKNYLTSLCVGDLIFNIDADEIPHENLINNLPYLLEHNSEIDMFLVPRINTVDGITEQHIQNWGWKVNEKHWINYPDFQSRIYKNTPEIRWEGKVHERIQGIKMYSTLPEDEIWSLYHPKTVERQEKQNNFYGSL